MATIKVCGIETEYGIHSPGAEQNPISVELFYGRDGGLLEADLPEQNFFVVHDGFKPYRRPDSSAQPPAHALCNAHHLHELKALIAFDGEPWVGKDAIVSATPAARSGKRAPEAKRPSHPPRSKPSTPAIGRPCAKGWPGIAAFPASKRSGRQAAARNEETETICCSACTDSRTTC